MPKTHIIEDDSTGQSPAPTEGPGPLLATMPTVEIEGRTYTLRRLGIADSFLLGRILAGAQSALKVDLATVEQQDLGPTIAAILMAGVPYAQNACMDLLASVIGVTREELNDANQFPMGSELQILDALTEHQDLLAFFTWFGKLIAKMPRLLQQPPRE